MPINETIERALWNAPQLSIPPDQWPSIIVYLIDSLGAFLGETVEVDVPWLGDKQPAFSCHMRPSRPASYANEVLGLCWRGSMGGEVIEGGKFDVSAWVFLFALNKRLCPSGRGPGYIRLAYEEQSGLCHGAWVCYGWQEDEFDEFESTVSPASLEWHTP